MTSIIAKFLSILPVTAKMRGKLYKLFNIGQIGRNFRIGVGSYIDSKRIEIGDNVIIGNMTRMKFLDKFVIGNESSLGSSVIICGAHNENKFLDRELLIGNNTSILSGHYFDVVAPIKIGNKVTIAGKWSQFYTHSFDLSDNRMDGTICIGNNVYIGAGCVVNLGCTICDNTVLQAGTCVTSDINEPGVYTSVTFRKHVELRNYGHLLPTARKK